LDGGDNLVDDFWPPRFGKIGNTFNELGRHFLDIRYSRLEI
jgi:hypothetical protein